MCNARKTWIKEERWWEVWGLCRVSWLITDQQDELWALLWTPLGTFGHFIYMGALRKKCIQSQPYIEMYRIVTNTRINLEAVRFMSQRTELWKYPFRIKDRQRDGKREGGIALLSLISNTPPIFQWKHMKRNEDSKGKATKQKRTKWTQWRRSCSVTCSRHRLWPKTDPANKPVAKNVFTTRSTTV